MMQASIRHQSVTRLYPLFWRAAFAASVTAALLFVLAVAAAIAEPEVLLVVATAFAARIVIEATSLLVFCRRLEIRFAVGEFVLAELLLPLYTVARAALAALGRFTWQGRKHAGAAGRPAAA